MSEKHSLRQEQIKPEEEYQFQTKYFNDPNADINVELRESIIVDANSIIVVLPAIDHLSNRATYEDGTAPPISRTHQEMQDEAGVVISKHPLPVVAVGRNAVKTDEEGEVLDNFSILPSNYVYLKEQQPVSRLFFYNGVRYGIFDLYTVALIVKKNLDKFSLQYGADGGFDSNVKSSTANDIILPQN